MNDAAAGGHPLHVAGPDGPAVPGRILVLAFSFEHVRDGLEPAVRMVRRPDRFAWLVLHRPHLVEQQERIGMPKACARKWPTHDEAGPLLLAMCADDLDDLTLRHGLDSSHRPSRRRSSSRRLHRRNAASANRTTGAVGAACST